MTSPFNFPTGVDDAGVRSRAVTHLRGKGVRLPTFRELAEPAGVPREIVGRLSGEVVAILALSDVRESLQTQGAEPAGNSPEAFTAFIKAEISKWAKVVKGAGLRAD